MRELLALLVENVRRRWQEWRDRRVFAGDALLVEIGRWTEVQDEGW